MQDIKYGKWEVLIIHDGMGTWHRQFRGLSTWDKPMVDVITGDELYEMDTKKIFMYESETPKWWEQ